MIIGSTGFWAPVVIGFVAGLSIGWFWKDIRRFVGRRRTRDISMDEKFSVRRCAEVTNKRALAVVMLGAGYSKTQVAERTKLNVLVVQQIAEEFAAEIRMHMKIHDRD